MESEDSAVEAAPAESPDGASIPTHTTSCVFRYQIFTLGKVLTV